MNKKTLDVAVIKARGDLKEIYKNYKANKDTVQTADLLTKVIEFLNAVLAEVKA